MVQEKNIERFNQDIASNAGYIYSTAASLSSRLANERLTVATRQAADLAGRSVIDVGCGDGTYTLELLAAKPGYLLGVDAAEEAITCAKQKSSGQGNIDFATVDIYHLDNIGRKFDVAIVRGVLHHLYDVEKAIDSLSRIADEIIVIEPNGYNPVLKLLERFSRYHRDHEEKSYTHRTIDGYFRTYGGRVVMSFYCGLVPFFCPDAVATLLKRLEPFVERTPVLKQMACAVFVLKIKNSHAAR